MLALRWPSRRSPRVCLLALLAAGCQPKPAAAPPDSSVATTPASDPSQLETEQPQAEAEAETEAPPRTGTGSFVLTRGGEEITKQFGPEQLVSCAWYAEPERGDYVWVRLAEDPGQNGDAGPRLDIDLCRLSAATGSTALAPMIAGAHGSHCAPEPGFAIWWHEGEAAFNSGPQPDPSSCTLELDFDPDAMTLAGRFACAPLELADHQGGETAGEASALAVGEGSFRCELRRARPPN